MQRVRTLGFRSLGRRLAGAGLVIALAAGLSVAGASSAAADPSANAWLQLRICESSNRYDIDTGNGYYGAYQFSLSTWASVGGTGKPSDASPAEQDYRALVLYRMRGWQPWTCAVMVGLTEDADARSKVMPPEPASFDVPYDFTSAGSSAGAVAVDAPPWPGQEFGEGDVSDELKTWQTQLSALGYDVIGTGYFGPSTAAAVLDLQAKAGLDPTARIDEATWRAAWALAAPQAGGSDQDAVYQPQTKAQCGVGAAKAPPAPATMITYGQTRLDLQCWQWQAGSRGAPLSGTAYFGDVTASVAAKVQQQNGITGETDSRGRAAIGPRTWAAVWEGAASF